MLITGDGDFGLLAARHAGPVLVVSGAPSGRVTASMPWVSWREIKVYGPKR